MALTKKEKKKKVKELVKASGGIVKEEATPIIPQQDITPTPKPQPKDPTTYQIGDTIFPDRESYNKAKGLIEMRTPPGSKQIDLAAKQIDLAAGDAIRQAVAGSEAINPSPFTSPAEAQKQEDLTQQIKDMQMQEAPTRRDLSPVDRPGSQIPIIGGIATPISNMIISKLAKSEFLKKRGWDFQSQDITPEQLRTAALTQIEEDVYNEGITASEKFGAFVESIPIAGSLIRKYAGGTIETPTGNVETLVNTIRSERGRATKYETWAKQGELDPDIAFRRIEEVELNVQMLESRIKLLTNYSPELRFNSDGLNKVETEILRTREVLLAAKANALRGAIKNPDDMNSFMALQSFDSEDAGDFEI